MNFNGASTAGMATLDTRTGGTIQFNGTSTAGSASITNGINDGTNKGGGLVFAGGSMAGTAIINNYGGGSVTFQDTSNAGSATINNGNALGANPGSLVFTGSANAGSASILAFNSASVTFQGNSTAGNASISIDTDSSIVFTGNSSGGTTTSGGGAGLTVNGKLDITAITSAGLSIGSLAGSGTSASIALGSKVLTVGSNNASTEYDGKIQGNVSGGLNGVLGGSGALVKVGTGTLTLGGTSETDIYSSLTIIGGAVAVSSDQNISAGAEIGVVPATLIFAGGTLQIANNNGTATFARSVAVLVGSTANISLGGINQTVAFTGGITGGGGLSLSSPLGSLLTGLFVNNVVGPTVQLSGVNSYSGATSVGNLVTLVLQSDSSITQSASLTLEKGATFIVNGNATATFGVFSGTGTFVSGGNVVMQGATLLNAGIYKDDLTNAGTVTNSGTFIGNITSNTGTVTNSGTVTGAITTSGTFTNMAGGTVSGLVTNSGTGSNDGILAGGLTNTGGTFLNTGTIDGVVTISGGTFSGAGSIGVLKIANGASFAPGDGTPGSSTTINGSLAFASGSAFGVSLNPTTASFAKVKGTATLGGATVNAGFANGSYVAKRYTILTSLRWLGLSEQAAALG